MLALSGAAPPGRMESAVLSVLAASQQAAPPSCCQEDETLRPHRFRPEREDSRRTVLGDQDVQVETVSERWRVRLSLKAVSCGFCCIV